MGLIEVKGVTKRFGEHIILDNLNFEIEEGSILGLIGRSGCGKTTLLNLIIGYLKPNKGSINYKGINISKLGNKLGKNLGFACQEGSFYKKLSVIENLSYFGKLYGLSSKDINERTNILLNGFSLDDALHTLGSDLSIGMQKRLDIACALIHDPDVLILDEPTANLDPILRKTTLDLIKKINDSGTTIIISSHVLGDISALCHKVLVLDNKRVVAFDTPKNLELKCSASNVIKLESELMNYSEIVNILLNKGLITNYHVNGTAVLLFTNDTKSALKQINHHYSKAKDSLIDINITMPSLDSIFEIISGEMKQ